MPGEQSTLLLCQVWGLSTWKPRADLQPVLLATGRCLARPLSSVP